MKITRFDPRVTKTTKKARIYVSPQGETVLENFMVGRYTRPHQAYRALVLPLIRELYGQDIKLTWSQRAGCSCRCSPGFIASRVIKVHAGVIEDIFVDVAA